MLCSALCISAFLFYGIVCISYFFNCRCAFAIVRENKVREIVQVSLNYGGMNQYKSIVIFRIFPYYNNLFLS